MLKKLSITAFCILCCTLFAHTFDRNKTIGDPLMGHKATEPAMPYPASVAHKDPQTPMHKTVEAGKANAVATDDCETVLANENGFEDEWGLWNPGDENAHLLSGALENPYAISGSGAAVLSANAHMYTGDLDFFNVANFTLDFQFYAIDTGGGAKLHIMRSTDGGETYQTENTLYGGIDFNDREPAAASLSVEGTFSCATRIKIWFEGSNPIDFVAIDSVVLRSGCRNSCTLPAPTNIRWTHLVDDMPESSVKISWDPVPDATSYTLEYAQIEPNTDLYLNISDPYANAVVLDTTTVVVENVEGISHTMEGLLPSTSYYITVTAYCCDETLATNSSPRHIFHTISGDVHNAYADHGGNCTYTAVDYNDLNTNYSIWEFSSSNDIVEGVNLPEYPVYNNTNHLFDDLSPGDDYGFNWLSLGNDHDYAINYTTQNLDLTEQDHVYLEVPILQSFSLSDNYYNEIYFEKSTDGGQTFETVKTWSYSHDRDKYPLTEYMLLGFFIHSDFDSTIHDSETWMYYDRNEGWAWLDNYCSNTPSECEEILENGDYIPLDGDYAFYEGLPEDAFILSEKIVGPFSAHTQFRLTFWLEGTNGSVPHIVINSFGIYTGCADGSTDTETARSATTATTPTKTAEDNTAKAPTVSKTVVYPNPSKNSINLANLPEGATMEVFDLSGRLLQQGPAKEQVDVSTLAPGMHILRISTPEGTSTEHKFIKE